MEGLGRVLDDGITAVGSELTWELEAFAVAAGRDEATGCFLGLAIPHADVIGQVTDSTLLVRSDLALAQRGAEDIQRQAKKDDAVISEKLKGGTNGETGPDEDFEKPPPLRGPKNTRFFGVAVVSPERYARDLTRLSQEVIQHLAAADGVDLEIRVEISARCPGGYGDDKVRNVTENARTLKFETYGFEDS